MPMDKHATTIAVILFVFPDFILPLEVECLSPTGWVLHAENRFLRTKGFTNNDEHEREVFKNYRGAKFGRAKIFCLSRSERTRNESKVFTGGQLG